MTLPQLQDLHDCLDIKQSDLCNEHLVFDFTYDSNHSWPFLAQLYYQILLFDPFRTTFRNDDEHDLTNAKDFPRMMEQKQVAIVRDESKKEELSMKLIFHNTTNGPVISMYEPVKVTTNYQINVLRHEIIVAQDRYRKSVLYFFQFDGIIHWSHCRSAIMLSFADLYIDKYQRMEKQIIIECLNELSCLIPDIIPLIYSYSILLVK